MTQLQARACNLCIQMAFAWKNVPCGCWKCKEYNVPMRGLCDPCLKIEAYEDMLAERAFQRVEPVGSVRDKDFVPMSPDHKAEWVAFIRSPGFAKALELSREKEAAAKRAYDSEKYDVVRTEGLIYSAFPEDKIEERPYVMAYLAFMREQNELLKAYKLVKDEEAYKALTRHINTHGQLIREMPKHEHKKVAPAAVAPKHVGRRAARKANHSESSG